ncbi:flagellar basal-body rod protein FlgF [Spirochaeta thermophila DSM 6578]|uniref:Flagellar basal-body rod protein FlgF n=1 Tax=Winmispira thermophila (strain ATCC 700085 / DSM 6578 / Z-1203) TaxID=869211 RepID=G0GA05_WINT7|nr:flagellar hook-basal body protein [Spirochaeta thermophila]AEJ61693.1 flagellar basal-body rod protein FlgF [Spirochaeta thermophila DSM 6578]
MIRGYYIGASGMASQLNRMDAIANNLANVDLTGYKRDTAIFKAFPELLIRRMNDKYFKVPWGSIDNTPVVGKLGTGVETNEVYTVFEQGPLKETKDPFHFALEGQGFFTVLTPQGERYTRNGSFILGPEGLLVTKEGYPVVGENGLIHIKANNFVVDEDGRIFQNARFAEDPDRLVALEENEWDETELVDRLKIVNVRRPRYLQKQGDSLWRTTRESGEAEILQDGRPKVRQGFLEGSNVNPVTEMVQMIEVNRAYEANQKTIETQDSLLGRLINEALKI